MNARSDAATAGWLALLLFGIYLLSFSGQVYSQDSLSMLSVTESWVKRGDFDTDQMWTLFKARNEIAANGESYAKYGLGASLFAAPLYALALALPDLGLMQTTLLTSAVALALAGALVFLAARQLGFGRRTALAAALLFALATPAWVYAKQMWSEPFSLLTLWAAFYLLLHFRGVPSTRAALFAGTALGLAVATRITNAALVPFFALYGFWGAWRDARMRRGLFFFAGMLALAALAIAGYDAVRYGSPFATGYRADEQFDTPILLGLYGLLFSPGKGLFIYVPFLAALAWSAAAMYRRARAEALLILAVFSVYLVTFSTWYYWWGGTNWGPRFLVPTLPFLVLATTPAIELALGGRAGSGEEETAPGERAVDGRPRWARFIFTWLFVALGVVSVANQLIGVSIPALTYRLYMVRVSPQPDWAAIFFPQFSPLIGSWGLIRPRTLDFAWLRWDGSLVQVEWLVVLLTLGLIAFCAAQLAGAQRGAGSRRGVWVAALLFAAGLALFSLYRYRDDVRYGGSDAFRALLRQVEREEQPGDVLILDNDVMAPFWLNENRAHLRWYGLSRDPAQWDEPTRALLQRLARDAQRIWFAYDDSTPQLADPTREWLDRSLAPERREDWAEGVHLILYVTDARR